MPIFRVKSVKLYTGQKKLQEYTRGVRDKYQVWMWCWRFLYGYWICFLDVILGCGSWVWLLNVAIGGGFYMWFLEVVLGFGCWMWFLEVVFYKWFLEVITWCGYWWWLRGDMLAQASGQVLWLGVSNRIQRPGPEWARGRGRSLLGGEEEEEEGEGCLRWFGG